MMKLRRSARTILATLFILAVFTLLTIWHNKAPGSITESEKEVLLVDLTVKNPGLQAFLNSLPTKSDHPGFYLVGNRAQPSWPMSPLRACYADPLARLSQSDGTKTLVRYRSSTDFLVILDKTESDLPGTIASMDFDQVQTVSEPPFTTSLRFLVSILLGGAGVWVVLLINRKTKNSGKRSRR